MNTEVEFDHCNDDDDDEDDNEEDDGKWDR